ncbi:MAG: hypothetical protein ACF8CY_05455 [Gimesia chilikensis]
MRELRPVNVFRNVLPLFLVCFGMTASAHANPPENTTADQPGLVKQEFVYTDASFPSCHASTIVETPKGLVCAFFG